MDATFFKDLLSPPSVSAYPNALRVFLAVYFLWGLLWGLVAYHYGRASLVTWKQQGGAWKRAVKDMVAPYTYGWKKFLCWSGLVKDKDFCGVELPTPYTIGHYLRFSIFLGSLSPFFMMFLITTTDRDRWSYLSFFSATAILLVSTMGAGGHLYLAYKTRPGAWSRLIVLGTFWLLTAPFIFLFFNWP